MLRLRRAPSVRRGNATAIAAAACCILLTGSCGSVRGDEGPQRTLPPQSRQPQAATAPLMDAPPAPEDEGGLRDPGDEEPVSLVVPAPAPDPNLRTIRDIQDLLRFFGEPGIISTGMMDPPTEAGIARFERCLPVPERGGSILEIHQRMRGLNAVGWKFTLCPGAFDPLPLTAVTAPAAAPDAPTDTLADAPPEDAPPEDALAEDAPVEDAPAEDGPAPDETPPQVAMLPPPPPPSVELAVGKAAYAIESISCEGKSGTWVLLYRGTVAALGAESVDIDVDSRIGLRYWPEAEGVNDADWFCVPRRRFCYAPVAFTDWKGTVKANDRISSSRNQVFDDALGPRGVQQFIQSKCGA